MPVLLLGSSSILSAEIFQALHTSGQPLAAAGVWQRQHETLGRIIDIASHDLELLAQQAGLPVIAMQDVADAQQQIEQLGIDTIVLACYPHRLPQALIDSAPVCINIHPSLLPRYRGPEPVFWQFRDAASFGVSIHRVNARFDAGELIAQAAVELPTGCDYATATTLLARQGASLLLKQLEQAGEDGWSSTPQNEAEASYQPYPDAADFVIDTGQPAEAVFNFMCGTVVFGNPYRCVLSEGEIWLQQALDFKPDAVLQTEGVAEGELIKLQCKPGVLIARLLAGKLAPADTL